jgi:hypothetical protein
MYSNGYQGDSPGKMRARANGYGLLNRASMYGGMHIVVAGGCGDILYLLQMGVPANHIIACDKSAECVRKASMHGVIIPPKGAAKFIDRAVVWAADKYHNIASINVDVFGTLSTSLNLMIDILDTCGERGRHSLFMYTIGMRGDGLSKDATEINPGFRRIHHFKKHTGVKELAGVESYQSWTKERSGSPMCVLSFWK